MVDKSSLLIAVEGKPNGGTARTIAYARELSRTIELIKWWENFEHRYKCGKRVSQNGDTLNLCCSESLTKNCQCAIIV